MSFIINTVATAVIFGIVAYFYPEIDYGGEITNLLVIAVIAGVVNGLIKPVIKLLALPLTMATLGLFGIVINGAMLLIVAWVTDLFGITFSVGGFPPDFGLNAIITAIIAAVAMTIVGFVVHLVIPER